MAVKQEGFEKKYGMIATYEVATFAPGKEEPTQAYLFLATPDQLRNVFEGQDPEFYKTLGSADRIVIKKSPLSVVVDQLTLERIASLGRE
ncbi:MAG: hypothetical protein WCV90_06765 [Candidatus Woesearchaeota archaeon]